MKIRNGFVSNSSSTSFIVSKDRKDEAIKMGLNLIAVSDIKKWIKQADDMGLYSIIRDLSLRYEIERLQEGDYITEPYDRDRADTEGIDFPEFKGDL